LKFDFEDEKIDRYFNKNCYYKFKYSSLRTKTKNKEIFIKKLKIKTLILTENF